MCGIAGRLDWEGSSAPAATRGDEVAGMLARIGHRGPDEAGLFADPYVALGAVRLKVVDLLDGQQPMVDASGRWCLAYNGEVYNFVELRRDLEARGCRFRSRSDTEVVLQAWIEWGADALSRLEGGFAFALFDRQRRELFLARDRFGKRPLFYTQQQTTLLFASEMKAFFAHPGFGFSWDPHVLGSLFAQWTCIDGETPYRGIRQLCPGSCLRVAEGRVQEQRWSHWPRPRREAPRNLEDTATETAALLRASVQRRLRSDVEVGVTLSGGLDSAIVATLVREQQPGRLRAYSVEFDSPEFDERADQRLMAEFLAIEQCGVRAENADIAENFDAALWHAEVPQFRTAFVPMYLLARRIRADGIVVVLSGEGADEVFLGYDLFKETRLRAEWFDLTAAQRQRQLGALYPYLPHFGPANAASLGAVLARSSSDLADPLFSHALRLQNGAFAQRLLREGSAAPPSLRAAAQAAHLQDLAPIDRAQWLEATSLLQGYLLSSQGDRMSFAHGVEQRNPFLAPALVDFAAGLPLSCHLSAEGREKHLLKQAFGALLPARIVDKPKQPYRAPDAAAFRNPCGLLPWVRDALAPQRLADVAPLAHEHAAQLAARMDTDRPSSPREDQAFVLLLSLVLLDDQFVKGRARARTSALPPLQCRFEPAWSA